MRVVLISLSILLLAFSMQAQQTVGLFLNTVEASDGYTLFAPSRSKTTYLINNCGEQVHSWTSSYRPGQAVYLLENGLLLRTGNTNNSNFNAGGVGGIVEIIDWSGTVVWDYTISTGFECQHHDVEYLPNGNILAVVWDSRTQAEAIQAGRTNSGNTLWSEKIIEIEPDFINGGGTIVWEWKVWDHLVQDNDPGKDNFGVVSNSPELIDINFIMGNPTMSDWLHINSVDYNAVLDQIVLSSHNLNEIWIIDHSTTTAEASTHTGGNSGMGGDLLYRWGNPITYDQGNSSDQKFFLQHNAYWIDETYQDGGMIMVFNNQAGNQQDYSSVNVIDTPVDSLGNYSYTGSSYGPGNFHWNYEASNPTDFYAQNISGAQRLPNGNTIICEGPSGKFFEVDYSGNIVWEYVSPVAIGGITNQGSTPNGNHVFRAERYSPDFSGFDGMTLVSVGYIESGSTFPCETFNNIGQTESKQMGPSIYPNPAKNELTITSDQMLLSVSIYSITGNKLIELSPEQLTYTINVSHLASGMYLLNTVGKNGQITTKKIILEN
jgi:hypothetical protein